MLFRSLARLFCISRDLWASKHTSEYFLEWDKKERKQRDPQSILLQSVWLAK